MSDGDRTRPLDESQPCWSGPSESESHVEHQAALDATVFQTGSDPYELVLELDSGRLRLRPGLTD